MRHSTTVWNEQRRTQGRVQNKLSESGKKDTYVVAEKLKNVHFDYIFCSPLLRAVQTTNILNKYHKCKVIKDERITDIDQGIFSGRYFDSLTKEELELKRAKDKSCKMESLQEMYFRIKPFFDEITAKHKDKTILVVTHSGVASFLEKMITCPSYDEKVFNSTDNFENSEVKKFVV